MNLETIKNVILYNVLAALAVCTVNAFAKVTTEADDIKPVYIEIESGKQIAATDAFKSAIAGRRILKCNEVEAHVTSKGSASMKKKQ